MVITYSGKNCNNRSHVDFRRMSVLVDILSYCVKFKPNLAIMDEFVANFSKSKMASVRHFELQ